MDNGKKIASLILKDSGPPPEPKGLGEALMEDDESSDDVGLVSAAEELNAAIKSGDSRGIADALRSAFALLRTEPEAEDES